MSLYSDFQYMYTYLCLSSYLEYLRTIFLVNIKQPSKKIIFEVYFVYAVFISVLSLLYAIITRYGPHSITFAKNKYRRLQEIILQDYL